MQQPIVKYVRDPEGNIVKVNLALHYDGFDDYGIKRKIIGLNHRIFRFVLTENYGWVYYNNIINQQLWCCDDELKGDYIRLLNKSSNAEGTSLNYSFGNLSKPEIRSVVQQVCRDVPLSAFNEVPVSNLENA